jgi:hypothetical protein
MTHQVHKAVLFPCTAGVSDNDVIVTLTDDALHYDTWILGSSAGAMDVEVALVGTSYLATQVALLDMTSTTPATMVIETTAGKAAAFRGKFSAIRIRQKGATAVVAPSLIGYRTT